MIIFSTKQIAHKMDATMYPQKEEWVVYFFVSIVK